MSENKICPECSEVIKGRTDKKFCSIYCKSLYHYKKNQTENNLYIKIDKILKQNRRILKNYNKSGKSTVRKSTLLGEGFNPKYFTHYWKTDTGNLYLFCYEYGFMEKKENNNAKYILVTWQKYMNQ